MNIRAAIAIAVALTGAMPVQSVAATVSGQATWYGTGPGTGHAAAGPGLRRSLGADWRGTKVRVCSVGRCVSVRLTDWCACRDRRIIDLSDEDFRRLAPLSRGVIEVEVRGMIDDATPAVGSPEQHLSPQASGSNAPASSMSDCTAALVQAGTFSCPGFGRYEGRCGVLVPSGRDLCQFCIRTRSIDALEAERAKTIGDVRCPACHGNINQDGHFLTSGHRLAIAGQDLRIMADIGRGPR
jgi:hypothetical protein